MRLVAAGLVAIMAGLAMAALALGQRTITGSQTLYTRLPGSTKWALAVTVDTSKQVLGLSASLLWFKAMKGLHFRVLHLQVFYSVRRLDTVQLF